MRAAVRILHEELHWLHGTRHRLVADLDNPRVPSDLACAQIAAICQEIMEVEEALELLADAGRPFQPALPFDPPVVDQGALAHA